MFSLVIRIGLLCSALFIFSLNGYADSTDPVAIVNGEIITQQVYDDYLKVRTKQTPTHKKPNTKMLIEELIQRKLLKQDAIKKKLDKKSDFINKLSYLSDSLLMAMTMHDHLEKHLLDEATLQREYDRQIASINVPKEYKVRHILLETAEEAKAIIIELHQGKAFDRLAREKSIDIGSSKKGGQVRLYNSQKSYPLFG